MILADLLCVCDNLTETTVYTVFEQEKEINYKFKHVSTLTGIGKCLLDRTVKSFKYCEKLDELFVEI